MSDPDPSHDGVTSSEVTPSSRPGPRRLVLLLVGLLTLLLGVRAFLVETFTVPSPSMQRTLYAGDRILVWKQGTVQRGDVVVFDGTAAFGRGTEPSTGLLEGLGELLGLRSSERVYVKRVIGVGGDRVSTDESGRVSVNGRRVDEPYALVVPDEQTVDVRVPPGRLWVMGDHRANSDDSRHHLGSPGGGTVPEDDVIGTVAGRYWPLDRAGSVAVERHRGES